MKKKTLIVDEKIELRLPDESYAIELYNNIHTNRDYLGKWLPWVEHTNKMEDAQQFLKESRLFNKGGQKLITFIFYEKKLVGSVGLNYISKKNHNAELGYWLREDLQGKGIMTKACIRFLKYCFQHIDVHRIEVKISKNNIKSIAIPKRLGFTHEGTMREYILLDGQYRDIELFSLLKKESKTVLENRLDQG